MALLLEQIFYKHAGMIPSLNCCGTYSLHIPEVPCWEEWEEDCSSDGKSQIRTLLDHCPRPEIVTRTGCEPRDWSPL